MLPRARTGDHVFSFLGALLSSRRFSGNSILSCCSYSVVDAIHLCDGQRPDGLVRPPALCSQYKAGGCAKSAGFISGGDMKHVCADPFPHGLHTIYIIVRLLLPLAAGQLPAPPAPFPFLRQLSPRAPAGTDWFAFCILL